MNDKLPEILIKAVGLVKNEIKETPPGGGNWWEDVISEVVVGSSLTDALDGLENYSNIIILYWMHRIPEGRMPLKIHPRGNQEIPVRGLFATRTPNRPNRIGKTTVSLLERRGNILKVKGLDAIDGSPVIDIKPYTPDYDSPPKQ
jgi:tRNA-Thr(GGU) m(6)t(6)A37 methyltransferase TsaA